MKEYLKMSDGFDGVEPDIKDRLLGGCISKEEATYAAHAINSHDELVAEVERLKGIVESLKLKLEVAEEINRDFFSEY